MEPSVVATRCGAHRSLFDRRSGLMARYGLEGSTPSPELLELCLVGGDDLIEIHEVRLLLDQAPLCRQILLVGASETHPALPTILRTIRDRGVLPTLVTTAEPPRETLDALVRFSGFVSIDCGFNRTQMGLVRRYRDVGLRTSLHLPMADASVDWLGNALENGAFDHLVHSVVLTGRAASGPNALATGLVPGPAIDRLVELASRSYPFRLSADARVAPFLADGDIGHPATLPKCEACRSGLFVDYDLTVKPCSLLDEPVLGSLRDEPLERLWTGRLAASFRRDRGIEPPCAGSSPAARRRSEPTAGKLDVDLRFGHASSSLCDRALLPLSRSQLLQILTSVKDWSALRFFAGHLEDEPSQVAASWSSLEYFLSLPPLWGQDLARLHEQLVAGTFEGQAENIDGPR